MVHLSDVTVGARIALTPVIIQRVAEVTADAVAVADAKSGKYMARLRAI